MVCIYCDSPTKVSNSRPQKRRYQVWRRRTCTRCGATFSTLETVDFSTGIVIRGKDGTLSPFSRDRLFVSILQAVGHRRDGLSDASGLTTTIASQLLRSTETALIESSQITKTAAIALKRFDSAAAVQYVAYHKQP